MKKSEDGNFELDENDNVFQTRRKHCGNRRNCLLRAIPPFSTVFFKRLELQTLKNQGLFGKALTSTARKDGDGTSSAQISTIYQTTRIFTGRN